jgi:hypothetical protein
MNPPAMITIIQAATTADWVEAVGTWAVGLAVAWIAGVQFRNSKFRPAVWSFCDTDRRIMIRVVNQGTGSGLITDVNLMPTVHLDGGDIEFYQWELDGKPSTQRPVPFTLSGNASAQLFLIPDQEVKIAGLRVRVDYGGGKDSGCQPITVVEGRLFGSTVIDGVTQNRGDAGPPEPA